MPKTTLSWLVARKLPVDKPRSRRVFKKWIETTLAEEHDSESRRLRSAQGVTIVDHAGHRGPMANRSHHVLAHAEAGNCIVGQKNCFGARGIG